MNISHEQEWVVITEICGVLLFLLLQKAEGNCCITSLKVGQWGQTWSELEFGYTASFCGCKWANKSTRASLQASHKHTVYHKNPDEYMQHTGCSERPICPFIFGCELHGAGRLCLLFLPRPGSQGSLNDAQPESGNLKTLSPLHATQTRTHAHTGANQTVSVYTHLSFFII